MGFSFLFNAFAKVLKGSSKHLARAPAAGSSRIIHLHANDSMRTTDRDWCASNGFPNPSRIADGLRKDGPGRRFEAKKPQWTASFVQKRLFFSGKFNKSVQKALRCCAFVYYRLATNQRRHNGYPNVQVAVDRKACDLHRAFQA
jgi:hypothetical protein